MRKSAWVLLASVFLLLAPLLSFATDYTWSGGGTGWTDPANWGNLIDYPRLAADRAYITTTAATVTVPAGLIIGELTLNNAGSTVTLGGALTISKGVPSGSAIITSGTLSFAAAANRTLTVQGDLTIGAGSTISDVDSNDAIVFTGNATQLLDSGGKTLPSVQVNKSGGLVRLTGNNVTQVASGSLSFTCTGATSLDLSTNVRTWTLQAGVDANNSVTMNVGAGTLNGGQAVTVSGSGVLTHTTGTLTVSALTHSSSGASTLGTGVVSVSGALTVSGTGSLTQAGAGAVQGAGSIVVSNGSLVFGTGNLSLAGSVGVTGGTLNLGGKTVTGVTSLSVTGTGGITFSSVAMVISGDLTVNTTGTVTAGAAITMNNMSNLAISTGPIGALVVNNTVTVTASGLGQDAGALSFTGGSLAVNAGVNFRASSATVSRAVTVAALGTFATVNAMTVNTNGSVTGAGTGAVTAGIGLTLNGTGTVSVVNGALTVSAGGMALNGSGAVSSTGTGNIVISAGGLTMTGSSSPVSLSGGGQLQITGDLNENAASTGTISAGAGGMTVTGNVVKTAAGNGSITAGAGGITITGTLVNYSLLQVTSGNLQVNGAGANTNNGTITTVTGGTQSYTGNVSNPGTITGVGLLTFSGTLTSGGTLNMGGGGATVTGAADFSGGIVDFNGAGGAATLTAQGNLTFTAGSILSNCTGIDTIAFTGAAAQTFTTGGKSFGGVTVNKTALGVTTSGSLSVATLTMTAGTFTVSNADTLTLTAAPVLNGGTLTLTGALSAAGQAFSVTGTTVTAGTNAFTVGAMSVSLGSFTQTGSSVVDTVGSLSVSGTGTCTWDSGGVGGSLSVTGAITVSAGTLALGNKAVSCATIDVNTNGSIIFGGSSVTVSSAPNVINTAGVITAGTSTLTFNGAGNLTLDDSQAVGNLVIGAAVTLVSAGSATDAAALSVTGAGSLAAGANSLTVSGLVSLSGDYTESSGTLTSGTTVTLNGAADIISTGGNLVVGTDLSYAAASTGGIDFSGGAGAVTVTGNLTQNGTATGNLSVNGGDVIVGGVLTWRRTMTLAGASSLDVNGAGASSNTGTINTTGTGAQQYSGAFTNTGTMNGGGALMEFLSTLTSSAGSVNVGSGGLTVVGDATFAGSTLNGNVGANPDLTFQGNVTFGALFTQNSDRVVFSGALAQSVDSSNRPFANIRVDKTANGITLINNNMSQAAALGSLDINDGTVDLGARSWTLGANLSLGNANAPVLLVSNGTLTDGVATYSVTVGQLATLTATGTSSITVGDLTLNNATAAATLGGTGTFTFANILESAGTLALNNATVGCATISVNTNGDIDLGSASLTATGAPNVINTAGVITAGTSTLTFNGAGNLTLDDSQAVGNLVIGAAVTLVSAGSATDAAALSVGAAGSLAIGANDFLVNSATISGGVTVGNGGAFSTVGALGVNGGGSVSTLGTTGTLSVGGAATNAGTISGGSGTMGFSSTLVSTGTFNLGTGTVSVTGAASFNGGTLDFNVGNSLLVLADSLTFGAGLTVSNASATDIVRFTGALAQTVNTGGKAFPSVEVNKSGGSVTLITNNLAHVGGSIVSFTCTGATAFNLNALGWTLPGALNVNNNVTLNVNTGSLLGGQDLTVSGTGVVNHTTGVVTVNAYTHSGTGSDSLGTGNISIGGQLQVSGGSFTQTGNEGANTHSLGSLLVNGGSCTWDSAAAGGDLGVTGTVTVTLGSLALGSKVVTVGGVLSVAAGNFDMGSSTVLVATDATITTGGVFNAGTSTLQITDSVAPVANVNITLSIYHFRVSGTVPGGATLVSNLTVNGNLDVTGSLADGGRTITLYGNAAVTGAGVFTGTGTLVFANTLVDQTLDPAGASSYGNITKQGGRRLTVQNTDLTVTGTLSVALAADTVDMSNRGFTIGTLDNDGTLELDGTQGAQTITTMDTDTGRVLYNGAGGGTIRLPTFYNLEISSAGQIFALNQDITISGNLTLTAGTLDISASNYQITLSGDWINANGVSAFNSRNGTVVFNKPAGIIYIWGDNNWYFFSCTVPGIIIAFEQAKTQTMVDVAGATFRIKGLAGNWITLTGFQPPNIIPPASQWRFTLNPAAVLDMEYVNVDWSWATPYNITTPANVLPTINCTGWLITILVTADKTEDWDVNGKIDRIRVKCQANINDNFTNFVARVQDYTLASPVYDGAHPALAADEFWIMLQEKPYLDTDVAPRWWIDQNTSLRDSATGIYIVIQSNPAAGQVPMDAAPPIIGYTLAVADKNEIFVHFSEPVEKAGGGLIDETDFSYSGAGPITGFSRITGSGNFTREARLTLNPAFPVTATEAVSATITVVSALRDAATIPAWVIQPTWLPWPIPPTWLPTPPNVIPVALRTHRVTDVGLGLVGDGVMEPVWAHDQTTAPQTTTGIGRINLFDGTKWLRDQDITLTGHVHNNIVLDPSTKVWFDVGVDASLKSSSGLWLPPFISSTYNGIVPFPNPSARPLTGTAIGTQVREYLIPGSDSEIVDGAKVEFLFQVLAGAGIANDLFCARLTDPAAADWYRRVAPWAFEIHELKMQKGNVTILNNVINPDLAQMVTLHYIQPTKGSVTISVFDLAGNLVRVLARASGQAEGDYAIAWDGKNKGGRSVARGIYFIRIVAPGIDETRKVLVVR